MVSLFGWNFIHSLGRHDTALLVFVVNALARQVKRQVDGIATAFSQALRDFDTLITPNRKLPVEFGAGDPVLPARA
jgi:hypothetical protein